MIREVKLARFGFGYIWVHINRLGTQQRFFK